MVRTVSKGMYECNVLDQIDNRVSPLYGPQIAKVLFEEKISYLQCNLEASLCALQVHYFLKPIICQKEDALSMEQQ